MRYSNDGLTLWTGTPDAPATARAVTVGVSPAHPANAVEIRHRINGGGERIVRATAQAGSMLGAGPQYFHAVLPAAPPGARVEVLPTLFCAGRRCPSPEQGEAMPVLREATSAGTPDRAVEPVGVERFGITLEFLGTVWVSLRSPPEVIGEVPQGLRVNYYIRDGRCAGPRLNARILPEGADWMLIQRDGVAFPGVRTTWQTDDGALLFGEYSGVFELGPDGYARAVAGQFPKLPVVQLAPRFVTSDPRYAWLNRKQCVAAGAVNMDLLRVEFDLYAAGTGSPRG